MGTLEQTTPPTAAQRLSWIGRRLSLKPYGDELLTRSADFWIFSARLIILTMAAAEAMAWGYMGSLMSQSAPLVTGAIAAAFVFTLIWIIDASFMTLDLSRGVYERALTGRKEPVRREKLKLAGGVAARVGIVTASLIITAPFLAQAIFAGDVNDEMARRNANAVATKRQEIDGTFAARIGALRAEQQTLEQERVREAAGVGPSGRYGRGPALETIERQLNEKRNEIAALEESRAAALARFDGLSRPQLQEQYGLNFLSPGVHASSSLLGDLLKNPQFTGAELAVRAFLAFLFLGLLILKGFQPRSVAVYYNEQLHSIYDQYRKGLFDPYLPEGERAERGGTIDPLRFEEWCRSTYATMRREDERRRDAASEYRVHELFLEQWQRLEKTTRAELDPLIARHDAVLAAIDELEAELHESRNAAATASDELRKIDAAHASMRQHIDGGSIDGAAFPQAVAAERELDERRRALAASVRKSEAVIERCEKRLELRRAEAAALRDEIGSKQIVIAEAQKRISEERMAAAETIAGQRNLWSARHA